MLIKLDMALYMAQAGRCYYCGELLNVSPWRHRFNEAGWTRDHFIPKKNGGGKGFNLVLSCIGCNRQKGCRHPSKEEFRLHEVFISRAKELKELVEQAS